MSDILYDKNDKNSDAVKTDAITTPEQDFLSNPAIQKNAPLLKELGIIPYIDSLNAKIQDYQDLFSHVLSIFHHTMLDDILETAVFHITNRVNPTAIIFLWKSFQNKDEITIKGYKQYKMVNTDLQIESIAPFELFFQQYPKSMIPYADLVSQMNCAAPAVELQSVEPELIIPILSPSSLYGLILVSGKREGEKFTDMELVFIRHFMYFVSLAIQNHLNYDHSLRDVKTGLYNYGFFMTRLTEELARMRRNEYVSSVIVIDVDFFKKFNDTYGHVAGDRMLEYIATLIRQGVRLEDVPSRFGGEDFTVLLPDTNAEEAWGVAERLRKAIARLSVPWEIPLSNVTISSGIFTFDNSTDSTTEIVNKADKALYKSKERGRNCTTIWAPDIFT
ncbi:MAG: GGDEF domain-containing protein [Spirochaetaceae bacterium]|jgi:diguanylate cyclase (GGDEF)-like protein|nr:GGDEF domain-containing protein [Spirochaetaceae bacterium]